MHSVAPMIGSQESLIWRVSTAEQCWWEPGRERALLPCPLSHPRLSPLSTTWPSSQPTFLQLFHELGPFKIKRSWKVSAHPADGLWCPCCPPDWKISRRDCWFWCMDIAKQGPGWSPPYLDLRPGLEIRGGFSPLLTQHLGSWHRSQLRWAATRDRAVMACLETDLVQESIHRPWDETHFIVLPILQATQKALPKVP